MTDRDPVGRTGAIAASPPSWHLARRAEARWGAPDELLAIVPDQDAGYHLSRHQVVHAWEIGGATDTRTDHVETTDGADEGFDVRIYLTATGDLVASCEACRACSPVGSRRTAGIWGRHFGSLDEVGAWLGEIRSTLDEARMRTALDRAAATTLAHAHGIMTLLERDTARHPLSALTA